jgi:hypothetical protein
LATINNLRIIMAEENKVEEPKKEEESWIQKKWRPMMAVMYMCVCACDFIVFPIMFTVVQFWEVAIQNDAFRQWQPLTLQGGGLFHMAMGAVLGITAWSRGQEKMAGVSSTPTSPQPMGTPMGQAPMQQYDAPVQQQRTITQTTVTTGYGGKLAPPPAEHPPI